MPYVDVAKVRTWAARVPIAFWAQAAAGAISAVVSPIVVGNAFKDAVDGERTTSVGFNFGFGFGGGRNIGLQLLSLVSLGAVIALMVWGHHITQTARALGLRTALSPGWAAAGWLVPIVNFWFPYQVVRDALPPGHPARHQVGWWWGLHIGTSIIGVIANDRWRSRLRGPVGWSAASVPHAPSARATSATSSPPPSAARTSTSWRSRPPEHRCSVPRMRIGIFGGDLGPAGLPVDGIVEHARTAADEGFAAYWMPQIFGVRRDHRAVDRRSGGRRASSSAPRSSRPTRATR